MENQAGEVMDGEGLTDQMEETRLLQEACLSHKDVLNKLIFFFLLYKVTIFALLIACCQG